MADGAVNGSSNAALKVQVDGLASDIARIDAKIDRLAQPSTPQYTTWIAASGLVISVMVGFFTLGISPIKDSIVKNEAENRISIDRVDATARLARKEIADDLKDMRNGVVTRGEHEQRWRGLDSTDTVLSTRIDGLDKKMADFYGPRDAMKDIQQQINELRAGIARLKP